MDREAAARAIEAFLTALGRDPRGDPELEGTGARVAQAWADELLSGYAIDVEALLSDNVLAGTSDLVLVRDIPVASVCPHHLTPSIGHATVAFAPREHLVGLGAVVRLVDAFARRLALQEQIGERVAAALVAHVAPRWAACRIVLAHGCMTVRGERAHGSSVETVALAGAEMDRTAAYAALGVGR